MPTDCTRGIFGHIIFYGVSICKYGVYNIMFQDSVRRIIRNIAIGTAISLRYYLNNSVLFTIDHLSDLERQVNNNKTLRTRYNQNPSATAVGVWIDTCNPSDGVYRRVILLPPSEPFISRVYIIIIINIIIIIRFNSTAMQHALYTHTGHRGDVYIICTRVIRAGPDAAEMNLQSTPSGSRGVRLVFILHRSDVYNYCFLKRREMAARVQCVCCRCTPIIINMLIIIIYLPLLLFSARETCPEYDYIMIY